MRGAQKEGNAKGSSAQRPHRVRLPGFVIEEDIALGDFIKNVTYTFGIKPCGGCERRAAMLNSWMVFSGRK